MLDIIQSNLILINILLLASLLFLVLTALCIPIFIRKIPADYFTHAKRPPGMWSRQHPVIRFILAVMKNILGALFILIGFILIFMPGQGLLTIFIGFILVNFPGKYRLEKWLIAKPMILKPLNMIRARSHILPLQTEQL